MNKKQIGELGENLAADFLIRNGFEIKTRNYHSRFGEIDIVAFKDDRFHFIEVKTRTLEGLALAEESVGFHKRKKCLATIEDYIFKNEIENEWIFGLIAIYLDCNTRRAKIKHYSHLALF